jgi:hypothetical protein
VATFAAKAAKKSSSGDIEGVTEIEPDKGTRGSSASALNDEDGLLG